MYKVLLVDDDLIVRVGIKVMVDWSLYNLEIIDEASDGKQALQLFREYLPEVVFTDIRMPNMDGVELLKAIRQIDQHCKIIMLTNFDDKEYIKEALRLGANDFITKNELDEDFLNNMLKKLAKDLDSMQENGYYNKPTMPSFTDNKKQFLAKLINKAYDEESIEENFVKDVLNGEQKEFNCAIICVRYEYYDNNENAPFSNNAYLLNLVQGAIDKGYENTIALNEYHNCIKILITKYSSKLYKDELKDICSSIINTVCLYLKVLIKCSISNIIDTSAEVKNLLKNAFQAELISSVVNSQITAFDEILANNISIENTATAYNDQLSRLHICDFGELNQAKEICLNLIDTIYERKNATLKYVFCNEFASWYNRLINRTDIGIITNGIDGQTLTDSFSKEHLLKKINEYFDKIISLNKESSHTGNDVVDAVIAYVKENYSRQITLLDMATKVHLSKNYLSGLFSNVTGVSFIDFVTHYKIKKATDFLTMTTLRIDEISTLVGFSSTRYFSQTFKHIMGKSPTEYRHIYK